MVKSNSLIINGIDRILEKLHDGIILRNVDDLNLRWVHYHHKHHLQSRFAPYIALILMQEKCNHGGLMSKPSMSSTSLSEL